MTVKRVRQQKCPHCGSSCGKTSSRPVTALVREEYYSCSEMEACGHTFVVQSQIIRTLTPSRRPNPRVAIPFGVARSAPPQALPAPANDQVAAALTA